MGKTPIKNITEFLLIVIVAIFCFACSTSYSSNNDLPAHLQKPERFDQPIVVANVEAKEINESSGLIVSKCQSDVFWTHNDSGDGPYLYAFNGKGKVLGTWRVENAKNIDWEDIAMTRSGDKCLIYIGDIGNNARKRKDLTVYRIAEPVIDGRQTSRKAPAITQPAESFSFVYPETARDAETLMVEPNSGDIYIATKRISSPTEIFKLNPDFGSEKPQTALLVFEYSLPSIPNGFVTGGDISTDGKRVLLCDYVGGYEISLDDKAAKFDDIWKAAADKILLGVREQGEACAYSPDGNTVFATSEKKNFPLISAKRKSLEK